MNGMAGARLLLDVTFPNIECADLNLSLRNTVSMTYRGVTEKSQTKKFSVLNGVETPYEAPAADQCLPCYEAATSEPGQCCNTCRSLIETFFERGLAKDRDFSGYPQCQRGGCRAKVNALFAGKDGKITYIPRSAHHSTYAANDTVLASQKWDLSHIINSASLSPLVGGNGEAVPLNIARTGELVEAGIDDIHYDALSCRRKFGRAKSPTSATKTG